MDHSSFTVDTLAHVIGGRSTPTDDHWGGTRAIIRLDSNRFGTDSIIGIEEFSHLEVVFRFHLAGPNDYVTGSRRPRNDSRFPDVGIFSQRNMRRPNWLGVSRCRLVKVDGLDLHVDELDAVNGSPVLDIKPWFAEFGPHGEVQQAAWSVDMLGDYFAP